MPSALLVLGFASVLAAGLLLTSSLRDRSLGEVLKGITSPNEAEASKAQAVANVEGGSSSAEPSGSGTPSKDPNKNEFAVAFAHYTGLSLATVRAWMNHEQGESTVEGGNNWLNVEAGPRGEGSNQIYGPEAKYVESLSPTAAAKYTAEWIAKNTPSIVQSAGHGSSAEVTAIEDSGFAGSHYGNESPSTFLSAG